MEKMTPEQIMNLPEDERRKLMGNWLPKPEADPPPDTLLLKDYAPHTNLVSEDHTPLMPKFPVVDAHTHIWNEAPEKVIRAMDATGVETMVNMGVGTGEVFDAYNERYVKPFPGRIVQFASFSWVQLLQHEDFGQRAADAMERCVEKGARGAKIFKQLGLSVRLPSGELLRLDDPRLDPIYARAGALGIPVCIHAADPPAFFQPLDRHNERYLVLMRNPHWHWVGPQFPSREEIMQQVEDVFARFPATTFIAAHCAWYSSDLPRLTALMDRFQNVHVDIAACLRDLGRQPRAARRFFLRFPDRIMFGTDGRIPAAAQLRGYYRFLETDDEHFTQNPSHLDRLYGIQLPDDVLEKVYRLNARRLLIGSRGREHSHGQTE